MRAAEVVLTAAVFAAQTPLLAFSMYNLIIMVFGLRRAPPTPGTSDPPRTRFAVVVPAHDEERVIAKCVESILAADYPRDLLDVTVVADHCSDRTADAAVSAGARVLERSGGPRGKAPALEWAFARVLASEPAPDAVCVVDADNLVHPLYFRRMGARLARGRPGLLQGYLDVKNPDDTWITSAIAIFYWATNRLFQMAKTRMGLACALGGTGWCVSASLLREHGFGVTALTDDLEYQMKLLLRAGVRAEWVHDAVVFDEKPLRMRPSWRQRTRWMQGHWDVAFRYAWPLLKKGARERSLAAIDGAVYCVTPSRVLLASAVLLMGVLQTALEVSVTLPIYRSVPSTVWFAFTGLHYLYPLIGILLERKPARYVLRYVFVPIFAITWIPIGIHGFLTHRRKGWVSTAHQRDLSLGEVLARDGGKEL